MGDDRVKKTPNPPPARRTGEFTSVPLGLCPPKEYSVDKVFWLLGTWLRRAQAQALGRDVARKCDFQEIVRNR